MADDNYILGKDDEMGLEPFTGSDIHAILTFIDKNYNILNNKICMFSAKLNGDNNQTNNTILTTGNWELSNGTYNKKFAITNTPSDFDYSNGDINFIIAPTEDKGYKGDNKSEESSSILYNNSVIRCNEYSILTNQEDEKYIQLSFLADDVLEYNIYLNILVLYKPINNFKINKE